MGLANRLSMSLSRRHCETRISPDIRSRRGCRRSLVVPQQETVRRGVLKGSPVAPRSTRLAIALCKNTDFAQIFASEGEADVWSESELRGVGGTG